MKKLLLTIITLFTIINNTLANNNPYAPNDSIDKNYIYITNENYVFVCTGSYAYAYHSNSSCAGLNNCQSQLSNITESSAQSLGRVPCCRCWINVSDRCKDDATTGSSSSASPNYGSGSGEAYIIIAAATVVAGAFIFSNELSVSRIQSFYNLKKGDIYYGEKINKYSGKGWDFRLRKDFNKSGLEYGANYMKYAGTITNTQYSYTYDYSKTKWSFYIDYVHDIKFIDNEKLKAYAGPSIKYLQKFGYGGIVGVKYQLFPGFTPDLRYEYTTQSNQFQLGVQILYKKRKS